MTAPTTNSVAQQHWREQTALSTAAAQVAGQMWDEVDPRRIVDSWAAQVPELTAVVTGAQRAAARSADGYTEAALAAQGLDDSTDFAVEPDAFAGQTASGGPLMSLLTNPAFVAVTTYWDLRDVGRALSAGRGYLDTIVRTEVADAGRLAGQVSMTSHPSATGYVRQTDGNPCARCLMLAGRVYRWNRGFLRHPRCGCVHVPTLISDPRWDRLSPRRLYDQMTDRQRARAGFTIADRKAIADGADINQIINARHRPTSATGGQRLTAAGERPRGLRRAATTTEGTTAGRDALFRIDPATGAFVPRIARGQRMTVDEIYRIADGDRALTLDLLGENGYLAPKVPQPTLRELQQMAREAGIRRPSQMSRHALVQRLEALRPRMRTDAALLRTLPRGGAAGGRGATLADLRASIRARGVTVPTGATREVLEQLRDDLVSGMAPDLARARAVEAIRAKRPPAVVPRSSPGDYQLREFLSRQQLEDDLARAFAAQDALIRQLAETGASARAATSRLRTQLRGLRVEPVDVAGRTLTGSAQARTARYVWRRPGGDIDLSLPMPAGLDEAARLEWLAAKRMSDVALEAERLAHAGRAVTGALDDAADLARIVAQVPRRAPAKAAKKAAKAAAPDLTGERGLSTDPAVRAVQVENRIRQAYAELRTGMPEGARQRGWVNLADIREHRLVVGLDRAEVNAALRAFINERRPGAFLEAEMNQAALTARDRAAAVWLGGENNHFLRLDDPSLRPLPAAPAKAAKKAAPRKATTPPAPERMSTAALKTELQRAGVADIPTKAPKAKLVEAVTDLRAGAKPADIAKRLTPPPPPVGRMTPAALRKELQAAGVTPPAKVARQDLEAWVRQIRKADPETRAATVERIAAQAAGRPSRTAPTLREILDSRDAAAAERAIREGVEGVYAGSIRAEVDEIVRDADGIGIYGKLRDASGRQVGEFERFIELAEDGSLSATHELFTIERRLQGTGLAQEFNANLFEWYRRSGVTHVSLMANIDVGGYAWATKGFDFADAGAARGFVDDSIEKIGVALRQFESTGRLPKGITEADLRSLAAYMDDLREGRRVASAPEIARFGRQPGQGGKSAMWPGKWLMLGSAWAGKMPL